MVRLYGPNCAKRMNMLSSFIPRSLQGFHLAICGLALAAGAFHGCATPSYTPSSYEPTARSAPRPTRSQTAPTWRFRPLSWEKLESIETWLAGSGRRASSQLRTEAELTLARGRLTFATRDRAQLSSTALNARLDSAYAGFTRVLNSSASTAVDRQRAREGQALVAAQRTRAPKGLQVIPRSTWRAAAARPTRLTPNSGAWNRLTVHHSAEYAGLLRRASADQTSRAIRNIQRYHVEQKNYGDIAYHFLIDPSGRVFEGRSLRWQGAHAGGTNNVHNIGVCLLGDFDRESPSRASLAALETLVTQLRSRYGISSKGVVGHGELKTTACPGRHLRSWPMTYRGGRLSGGRIAAR